MSCIVACAFGFADAAGEVACVIECVESRFVGDAAVTRITAETASGSAAAGLSSTMMSGMRQKSDARAILR
jgi:hypothetical protein